MPFVVFSETLYNVLDWQRVGSRRMLQHYMNVEVILQVGLPGYVLPPPL